MKELTWQDESVNRYHGIKHYSRYYGHIKNPGQPVYISDNEIYINITGNISEALKQMQSAISEHEAKGYEYFEYDTRIEHDNNDGDRVDAEIAFFRKETEAEKEIREKDVADQLARQIEHHKMELEKLQGAKA